VPPLSLCLNEPVLASLFLQCVTGRALRVSIFKDEKEHSVKVDLKGHSVKFDLEDVFVLHGYTLM